MFIKITFVLLIGFLNSAHALQHAKFNTLGSSAKGQFVALEEYSYRSDTHAYVVTIKIMNVWKKEYVSEGVTVELPAVKSLKLKEARAKARELASQELEKYGISG
jgi:predicted secreted protein